MFLNADVYLSPRFPNLHTITVATWYFIYTATDSALFNLVLGVDQKLPEGGVWSHGSVHLVFLEEALGLFCYALDVWYDYQPSWF